MRSPFTPAKNQISEFGSKSIFKAEIVNKKQAYVRGKDSVEFRSGFKGNLRNGCFLNEIYMNKLPGVHDMSPYLFSPYIEDVDITRQFIKSFCPQTVERWSDGITGILNGNVNTDWIYWNWKIHRDIPLGKYLVNMTVLNNFSQSSYSEHKGIGYSFEVTD